MVLGLGITLCIAGLLTSMTITVLGLVLALMAGVGWFRNVLPHEKHEAVPVKVAVKAAVEEILAPPLPSLQARVTLHREIKPLVTFSFIAGIEGGLAGGAAMAIPATIFSLVKFHSLWYAMNLLAAGGFVGWANASDAFLSQFHPIGLVAAIGIHFTVSVLVGLLYGAMLPMFPRLPILTAGIMAPLLWSGLSYEVMSTVSPILSGRVDWGWFIFSQVAFGLVAGFVVNLRLKVRTDEFQSLPFAVRAGLHTDEMRRKRKSDNGDKE
jgi:hypothetical protein